MERLQVLCKGSRRRMRINPPAMERIYEEEFEQELLQAFNEALEQGQDAAVIYTLLTQHLDWDCMCDDPPLLDALLQRECSSISISVEAFWVFQAANQL